MGITAQSKRKKKAGDEGGARPLMRLLRRILLQKKHRQLDMGGQHQHHNRHLLQQLSWRPIRHRQQTRPPPQSKYILILPHRQRLITSTHNNHSPQDQISQTKTPLYHIATAYIRKLNQNRKPHPHLLRKVIVGTETNVNLKKL